MIASPAQPATPSALPAPVTRYQALRLMGCDPLSAGFVAFMNWARGVPPNLIVFLTMVIEIEQPDSPGLPSLTSTMEQGQARLRADSVRSTDR